MTQPAPRTEHVAQIIDLFEFCTPEQRAFIEAQRGKYFPRSVDWTELLMANMSDARDSAAILYRLGGSPILVHGVELDGSCTCGRADCGATGKHPVSARWQEEAIDLERLDAMLLERPRLNAGWRMGRQRDGSRLATIDVDGELDLLSPLIEKWGPLPATLTAATGSGGRHLIFRLAPNAPEIRNRRGVAPHVDIRGEGGMIVIAPSRHRSGGTYRWLEGRAPTVLP